jgi:hypothetical protein
MHDQTWVAANAMTPAQSKRLKIGQRVAWHDSADDQGTVSASDWSGVQIEWDKARINSSTTIIWAKSK